MLLKMPLSPETSSPWEIFPRVSISEREVNFCENSYNFPELSSLTSAMSLMLWVCVAISLFWPRSAYNPERKFESKEEYAEESISAILEFEDARSFWISCFSDAPLCE